MPNGEKNRSLLFEQWISYWVLGAGQVMAFR